MKQLFGMIRFKPIDGWSQVWYVSRIDLHLDRVEIRPLTVTGLLTGIVMNFFTMAVRRFFLILYFLGFLDPDEGEMLGFHCWTWDFRKTLRWRENWKRQLVRPILTDKNAQR